MKEQGSVLLTALFVMAFLLLLGGLLMRLVMTSMEISNNFSDGIAAFYVAEAGVRRVLVELDNNTTRDNFTEVLESGKYYVAISDAATKREKVITAIGQKNDAVRKAVVFVLLPNPIDFACFSGEDMTLSAKVIGLAGLRDGELTIKAGGGIFDATGNAVQPIINSSFKLPSLNNNYNPRLFTHAKRLPGIINNETYALQGVYFVDGDFVLKDAAITIPEHSSATIFVNGRAELSGDIGNNVTIISTDMITLKSTGGNKMRKLRIYAGQGIQICQSIEGEVLLMSKGDILINGMIHGIVVSEGSTFIESPVEGSVLADKMIIQGSGGEVKYDEDIFPAFGFTRPRILSWSY